MRWYFNQADFNIETEIQSDQFHKVDNIMTPDSIKSMLIIRNVNFDHFGDYKIRVEGGNQEIVERVITLKSMNPDDIFGGGTSSVQFSGFLMVVSILGILMVNSN